MGSGMTQQRTRADARVSRSDVIGGAFILLMAFQFAGVVILADPVRAAGVSIPSMLAIRFGSSGVILALILAVRRLPLRPAPGEGARLLLLGMVAYAAESAFYFTAIGHGTVTAVTLLFFTYPVLVALGGMALGGGAPGRTLGVALAASVAGSAVVVAAGGGVDIEGLGVVFALCSAVTYAAYLLGADRVLRRSNSLVAAMLIGLGAGIGLAAFALVAGEARWPAGWDAWWRVLAMGALTAGAFVCLFEGLRRLGALRTAIISSTEPLTVAILAAIFLGERIGLGTAVGGVLILGGAVAASVARRAPSSVEPPGP
jgi:drug/metabolite transporter (DMT)-like permease